MVCVVTVAIGDEYVRNYEKCLESHRVYARALGYDHIIVTKPTVGNMSFERYAGVLEAFERGHEWVLHIDLDAYVNRHYPVSDYTDTCPSSKDIIVMKECDVKQHCGLFGCPNMGVFFIRRSEWSIVFARHMCEVGPVTQNTDQDYFNSIIHQLSHKIDIRPWTMKHSFNGMLSFRARTFHRDDFIIHFITTGSEKGYIDILESPRSIEPFDFVFTDDEYPMYWERVVDMIPIGGLHPMHVFRLREQV